MNNVIVIKEVKYGTNAGQGMTASGEGGFDIWIRHKDNYMDFLGFIKHDEFIQTVRYYESRNNDVEIRYLPHE